MPFCDKCSEYAFGKSHQCPPIWDVWPEGEEKDFDAEFATQVYASNAQEAAEKAAEKYDDNGGDGPCEHVLFVRAQGDNHIATRFDIEFYHQVVYTAHQQ